jgi:phage baseplate assembly protein W
LRDIFITTFGERHMREWYGSFVMQALGRNITPDEILPVIASVTSAIDMWEPRFAVETVDFDGEIRNGRLVMRINGSYRPRALLGDMTGEGEQRIVFGLSAEGVNFL